jgi:hypothetical protein
MGILMLIHLIWSIFNGMLHFIVIAVEMSSLLITTLQTWANLIKEAPPLLLIIILNWGSTFLKAIFSHHASTTHPLLMNSI